MGTPDNEKEIEQPGFWNYEEEEGAEEDEEFQGDDITSMGHGELDQHREIREYQRMAAWELPLLNSLAKPFEPPAATQPLRFRYTTYMGEQHPAAKKVVVEFAPKDLPDLTDVQRDKLIKLCGVRYNPGTESVKMSCEAFETQAQNKRYLGDLVDTLLDEARDPKDTFEDVPFDFRHHQPKPFHAFPDEWRLTPERRAKLEAKRKLAIEADAQREAAGQLVDGTAVITEGLKMRGAAEPMLVGAGRRS
ncbi:hypothetical protein EJ06DRAFT_470787 [Trichodelitschia bisporula]|uniref:Small ribosomal subunit protein mS35 mitochondrial conserved domain-containing protein n=1 Tax=Trichodelitschia bisporula TaxID=703511 RepID=A0A6G1I6Z2_9PEZI|nr:hypothetical protein EJ06DRAFT_470787 [Trichodelitschia bisporula]